MKYIFLFDRLRTKPDWSIVKNDARGKILIHIFFIENM